MTSDEPRTAPAPAGTFATTRWTLVLAAGHRASPGGEAALEDLCRAYWYPLYAYVRRRGYSREDAEDRVQGFFARFLAGDDLGRATAERGRFRAFLLGSLHHFLANEWDRAHRRKRGGGAVHLRLDWDAAETRYRLDAAVREDLSPDRIYDREWALTLLGEVIERLGQECADSGRSAFFDVARSFLDLGAEAPPYLEAAQCLGMDPGALRVAVHRLRRRYRVLLREEIARTLAEPDCVESEVESLVAALSG